MGFSRAAWIFCILLAPAAYANPNVATEGSGELGPMLVAAYDDNFGNTYALRLTVHDTLVGQLITTGCSTEQATLGKRINGTWHIVIDATPSGDCIGGYLELVPAEEGFTGTWYSPLGGIGHNLVLTPM